MEGSIPNSMPVPLSSQAIVAGPEGVIVNMPRPGVRQTDFSTVANDIMDEVSGGGNKDFFESSQEDNNTEPGSNERLEVTKKKRLLEEEGSCSQLLAHLTQDVHTRGKKLKTKTCMGTEVVPADDAGDNDSIASSVITPNQHAAGYMNLTQQSQGKNTVVIIKPMGNEASKFMRDPVAIVKAINESEINKMNIKDVRTNKRKEIIVVELQNENQLNLDTILELDMLGQCPIKCYIPNSELYKVGVISPIDIGRF